jgi:gliding motility-associated-like protein
MILFLSWEGSAQNLSNRGREFWVGYGHHQFMEPGQSNSQEMVLYFSAEQAASVKVTIKGRAGTLVKTYNVPANTVIASDYMPKAGTYDCRLYDLPPSFGGSGGEGVYGQSIHIESDVPIVAYAHTFGSASSGATMLIPVETYGHQYYSLNSAQTYASNCFSWAYVVAAHDNTVVEITPSVQTRLGKPARVPFQVTLNKGQIYQVIGANLTGGSTALELTGTRFRSVANSSGECFPVAVFSGSSRTSNPYTGCSASSGDNDNQQCFPTQSWGKKYHLAPLSSTNGASIFMNNAYRVLVKDPSTVVTRNGTPLTGLINNSYYLFTSNTADVIVADKPIMVAQYMNGACLGGGLGDPEMIYLSPVEQGIKRVGFYRNTREGITANFLTLIIPTAGVSSLRIDGSPTFDHSYPHPNAPGYTVVVKRWAAQARQATASSDSAFTAVTYGLGSVESYGYNAGTFINNLSARSGVQNIPDTAAKSHTFTCVNTPVKLSALMAAYQPTRLDWNLSKLGSLISPNNDVRIDNPVPVDTVFINGIRYWRYELPGTYTFSKADTTYIPISGYHPTIENCYTREDLTIPVVVKARPIADFGFTHTGCTRDTIFFRAKDTTANGYVNRDFVWVFPGNRTVLGTRVDTLLPPGTYPIRLGVVTRDGCASDTIQNITISDKPSAGFVTTPSTVCMGTGFQFQDTAGSAITVNKWYWQLGNGKDSVSTSGPTLQYVYPTPGKYTVKHVSSSSPTCVSDTVIKEIIVYALPVVSFTNDSNGCIAPDGKVVFKATGSTSDGQTMGQFLWNFGDVNATPGNPNTASGTDTLHYYKSGTYSIKMTGVTVNGCTKDTVMTLTFRLKPALTFAKLDSVCESAPALSVAKASVTNNVTGTGTYKGPGTSASGQFDPAAAGPGVHTIWYVFKTTDNCEDSVSSSIRVWATPKASFTIAASGCLPPDGRVQFTGTSVSPDNQPMSYLWNFGDANATPANPNTSTLKDPSHDFSQGTYSIKLTVSNAHGCSRDTTITTQMNLKPVLAFDPLTEVCQSAAPFTISQGRVTNGLTGIFSYKGPGTNSGGQFNPATAGFGTHTVWYFFTTSGGCTDSISQTILVNATPKTVFSIPAGACLNPDGRVVFSNTSQAPDGLSLSWLWNFGDANATTANPNTSTIKDPAHDFKEGTYTVKLTATSTKGCQKDTSVNYTFGLKPVLAFGTLTPACEGETPATIARGQVVNGVNGTGVYRGPGTSSSGIFDPAAAGSGIHTIWYVFTTAGGCVDSISQAIEVYPRPLASFNATSGVCVGKQVTITNTSTIPAGAIGSWQWNLGDGNNPVYTNGNPFIHVYAAAGTNKITLTAKSLLGCISLPAEQSVLVSPPPQVSFTLPSSVCFPGNAAQFTNGTTVSDNSGLSYAWDFGDGSAVSGATNGSHVYGAMGSYLVRLTATSGKGCVDSARQTFSRFFAKPVAAFSVDQSDICQGVDTRFTDQSTDSGSTISTWAWRFGDGGSDASKNPVKRYSQPGRYEVTLSVTNAAGCTSLPYRDSVRVFLQPVVDAGPSFVVQQGTKVTFQPKVNDSTLTFVWNPAPDLSAAGVLRASVTASQDRVYRLTAIGQNGCTASDTLTVRILKPVRVPNAFSPNGDGVHDTWQIEHMADYPGSSLHVFNRYGQQVFSSKGYAMPWDGKVNGKDLPVGVYYYIIELRNGFSPLNGSITIIR